jgi:hypothetical protein
MLKSKHMLLTSSPGRPEDDAWSAPMHAYDDLIQRAAYHRLASDEEWRKAQACANSAVAILAATGMVTALSVEQNIKMWEAGHR